MEPNAVCDRCGEPSAIELGDEVLCGGCFHETGSCCGSFGDEEEGDGCEVREISV